MRKSVLRFSLLLGATTTFLTTAQAQQAVTNGTMETWVPRNNGEVPDQWLSTDDVIRVLSPVPLPATGTVTKTTDVRGGSFAAKLTNANSQLGEVPGFLVLGTAVGSPDNVNNFEELGGLPYISRPARMQLYYKFTGTITTPDSRPLAGVLLTKTTGGVRSVVARGRLYLPTTPGAATTYTLADVPLTYSQNIAPDSLHIAFGSGDYDGNDFPAGNALYIDNIVMVGTATATRDPQLQAAVNVHPNPSDTGVFTLTAPQNTTLLAAPITVADALGRVVLQQAASQPTAGTRTVDLSQRPAGIYSLRLDTPRGPVVHQLVVQ